MSSATNNATEKTTFWVVFLLLSTVPCVIAGWFASGAMLHAITLWQISHSTQIEWHLYEEQTRQEPLQLIFGVWFGVLIWLVVASWMLNSLDERLELARANRKSNQA